MTEPWGQARALVVADGGGAALRELAEAAGARVIGPVTRAGGAAAIAAGGFDAVLADLRRGDVPEALVEALAAVGAGSGGVVLLDREQLDGAAGALVFAPRIELLCEADAIAAAAAVRLALAVGRTRGAREESEAERQAQLRRIGAEMERLARALVDLTDAAPPARGRYVAAPPRGFRGAPPVLDAAAVRALIRARRSRDQYFDPALFADPAWDMLLDLMAARLEGARVSVSSLCIAAAVPSTTALRWIGVLVGAGLIVRVADPQDRRRMFIALSDAGADAMAGCLAAAGRGGALPW